MSALDKQIDGTHYKDMPIQPAVFIHANSIPFIEGCIIKYAARWREKGGIKDLEKIKHYAELLIELETKALEKITACDDGWIEWKGGECPVPKDATVQVEYRGYSNSSIQSNHSAGILEWNHLGIHDDIIKYRVVK
jgi:hypothetical protein